MKDSWAVSVIASILILGVLASAPGAAAVLITFEFTGEVTGVFHDFDPVGISEFSSVGDLISGTYTFDSLAPDTSGGSTVGTYAVDDFSVTVRFLDVTSGVGLVTFGAGPSSSGSILIANNISLGDELDLILQFPNPQFIIILLDRGGTVFDSDLLLLDPPDLSAFEEAVFEITFFDSSTGNISQVFGSITSLTLFTPAVTQAQLDAAEAQRDAALADLANALNDIVTLQGLLDQALEDLRDALDDLADALLIIMGLEELVEELGQPGPPVANQGNGQGVPAQGKNKP